MLQQFLEDNRTELLERCRAKVALRSAPRPSENELVYGIPLFLQQLIDTLAGHLKVSPGPMLMSARRHGHELLRQGFTIAQVVHDYGDLCQSITQMAAETSAPFSPTEFGTLNRCLDDVIAGAVSEYLQEREEARNAESTQTSDVRLGVLAHELRNLLSSAALSFELIKTGMVAVNGATSSLHERSLKGMSRLIDGSLAEVRLSAGIFKERIRLRPLLEEIELAAALEAKSMGIELLVLADPEDLFLDGDRQILAAVLANLLQNAFKFTRANRGSRVILRVQHTEDRIVIEIEDECGGLPPGKAEELFQPFEQRGTDHSGLGLGLSIARRGVESNDGHLQVRNLPGHGCIFTVELPRKLGVVEAGQAA